MKFFLIKQFCTFIYTYDPVGNRTQVIETFGTEEAGLTVTVTVFDDTGTPMVGKPVYVFDDGVYTNCFRNVKLRTSSRLVL